MDGEAFEAAFKVIAAFEALGTPHHLGGSLASSIHGFPRASLDADLVADLKPGQGGPFRELLGKEFYAEVNAIEEAIRRRRSFNVIFLRTMFKVDVFMVRKAPFDRESFRRSRPLEIRTGGAPVRVATPEDTVLHKLLWYRNGGCVSERQWVDVVGVIKVQGPRLDRNYLERWARRLKLVKLFRRVLNEAGLPAT